MQEVYITKFETLDENLVSAIQSDCNKWAPGIESIIIVKLVIAIRVTKPRIPDNIKANYEQMESEKTKFLISSERQRVTEKEAETQRIQNIIKAKGEAEVSKIVQEKNILEHETKKKIQEIENSIYLEKEKTIADAEFCNKYVN